MRRLNIVVSSSKDEEIVFNVDVDVEISGLARVDVNDLVEKAIDKAMEKIDERLREIAKRAEGAAKVPQGEERREGSGDLSREC